MGIDYGVKKTGIAVTDPLRIISSALDTVPTHTLLDYVADYFAKEEVELIIIGEPLHPDGNPIEPQHSQIVGLSRKLRKLYPDKRVVLHDERYTTQDAKEILLMSGAKKKKRKDKALLDKISAALILEDYMKGIV
jgi:putative Holliday junction resolvase